MEKGKLIVFEGIDGSGKSAHYRRVCSRLEAEGINYHHIVFPRYDNDSSALIRMYLGGRFGSNPSDVNAYTASAFFAVDRFASIFSNTFIIADISGNVKFCAAHFLFKSNS